MQSYGIAHVWAQGDFVTRAIAITLLVMSVLSWIVIVIKGWNVIRLNRLTKNAEQAFWHSDNFDDGIKKLGLAASTPNDNPFLALALSGKEAADHHHQTQPHLRPHGRVGLGHALPEGHDGRRHLAHAERSRDPRVGRQHGAVRRPVRHGLGHLPRTARDRRIRPDVDRPGRGPVGESLIMTAFGLFVAIPAVLGYNALTRANKGVVSKLRRFAHGLHAYFVTGASLASSSTRDGLRLATRAS